jgi:putative endonuclease
MPRSRSEADRRQRAERGGRWGETLAAGWLLAKGYRIDAMRFKTPVGEVDIIASRGTVTAFIEVKTRRSAASYGMALAQVNSRRISRAAEAYLARHPRLAGRTLRFDVIFLAPFAWPRHVKNAFPAV